jgi:hypothetical protein
LLLWKTSIHQQLLARLELLATGSVSITRADTTIKLILNIGILHIKKGLAEKYGEKNT